MAFSARIQRVIDQVDRLRDEVDDHWQIPRDEAELLAQLVRIGGCESLCEIGASYGFSALHLAAVLAERGNGRLDTFDIDPRKVAATRRHLAEAGLEGFVAVHQGDAREQLRTLRPPRPFDFVFIDAVKEQSFEYFEALRPLLAPRVLIVTDNTTTHAAELGAFVAHLRGWEGTTSVQVAVGNGFELTYRNG